MKNLAIAVGLISIFFTACSTDFDVTSEYEETMVVYGLLDASQDTQYIRISRGYISEDRSALEIAQDPDSIYYLADQLDVYIERVSDGARLDFVEDRNFPKDSGLFAQSPHLVYVLPNKLNYNDAYRLRVVNNVTGLVLSSETPMVDSFRLTSPSDFLQLAFTTSLVGKQQNGAPTPIDVTFEAAKDGKVYDISVRFYYRQWEGAVTGPGDTMFVEYRVASNLVSNQTNGTDVLVARYSGQSLLSLIGNSLSRNPNITREPLEFPLEYRYYAGAENFYNFLRTVQGSTGVTSLEAIDMYSNIEGGYGIFSSRFGKTRPIIGINQATKDSLKCSVLTRDLNFVINGSGTCN